MIKCIYEHHVNGYQNLEIKYGDLNFCDHFPAQIAKQSLTETVTFVEMVLRARVTATCEVIVLESKACVIISPGNQVSFSFGL